MNEVSIKELMTKEVTCVEPNAKFKEIIHLMQDKRHSCLVIAENNKPIGLLTERDMVHLICDVFDNKLSYDTPISDFMSQPPITLNTSETLFDALVLNRTMRIRHLPVIDESGDIAGIVTQSDLVNAHFHLLEEQAQIVESLVKKRTKNLVEVNEQLMALSMEDALMGIGNRRAMEVDLEHTHSTAMRYDRVYSVLLVDVDYFKKYNDFYGHQAGDKALQSIATCLKELIRVSDRIYRYGGEELLLLLPDTDAGGAEILSERITSSIITDLQIPHIESPFKVVTISGGAQCMELSRHATWADVIADADRALYQAKGNGRNQIHFT